MIFSDIIYMFHEFIYEFWFTKSRLMSVGYCNRKVYGRPDVHRNKASSPSNLRARSPARAPRPR